MSASLDPCCSALIPVVDLTRYFQVAPYVVLLYDHLLNFDTEVEYIWGSGLSPTTIAYYLIRYGGSAFTLFNAISFVTPLSPEFCRIFLLIQPWPACCILWLVQFVLQTRLYVLYNRSRAILAIMGTAFVAEIAVLTTIVVFFNISLQTTNEPVPGLFLCVASNSPQLILNFWWAPLAFESILCFLAIYVGIRRSQKGFRIRPLGGISIVDALIRGNVSYFIIVLILCTLNAAMWQSGAQFIEIPEGFAQALEIVTGCRLILHLRDAAAKQTYDSAVYSLSQPVFHIPTLSYASDDDES